MTTARIVLTLTALFALCPPQVHAEFVGLNIGASHWSPALSGSFNSSGGTSNNSSINLDDDLGIDDPAQSSLVFILEHPIPGLPNVKYQGYDLDSRGSRTLNDGITFNNQSYNAGDTVTSTFDLSHDDIVLYYELLDNWINLDFGVDLKRFNGEVELSGNTTTRIPVDETIPLLYLSARFDLPFNGFYVGADLNNFSLGDSNVEDSTIKLGYESGNGLGVEGGLKSFSLELNDANNLDTNLKYDGIYLNGFFHF